MQRDHTGQTLAFATMLVVLAVPHVDKKNPKGTRTIRAAVSLRRDEEIGTGLRYLAASPLSFTVLSGVGAVAVMQFAMQFRCDSAMRGIRGLPPDICAVPFEARSLVAGTN